MNRIKRFFLKVLLIVCLLAWAGSGINYAEVQGITPHLEFDKTSYFAGDILKINLILEGIHTGDKTNSVSFVIQYDGSTFELATGNPLKDIVNGYIKFNTVNDLGIGSTKSIKVMYVNMNGDTPLQNGSIVFSAYFKVKSNAAAGIKTFTLEKVNMFDSDIKVYAVNNNLPYKANVTIKSTGTFTSAPTPTPQLLPASTPIPTPSPSASPAQAKLVMPAKPSTSPTPAPSDTSGVPEDETKPKLNFDEFNKAFKITSAAKNGPKTITRADYLFYLINVLGLTAKFDSNFDDIKKGDYYYNAVGIAKKLGITTGAGKNMFKPKTAISRQDVAVLTVRAWKIAGEKIKKGYVSDLNRFKDKSSIAKYAVNDVAVLVKEGIIKGSGNNMLNPTGNLTRAEAAVLLYRIYNR